MKNYSVPELHLKVLKPANPSRVFKQFACLLSFSLSIFFSSNSVLALEDQETYSIFLVKTATPKELTYEVDNKRVHALTYIVQKGDSLWKILRKKGLLRQDNLSELLSVLKKLNRSLRNLDLIYPGEKIIIPLKITSLPPDSDRQKPSPRTKPPIITSKDLKYENHKVKPGDSIARVARRLYSIPPEDLYNEYLELVKKINPTLEDLNAIYAGQVIKLPIYSPEIARKPIEPAFSSKAGGISEKTRLSKKANSLANDLGKILVEMGEEWIPSGDHFVPFESGGFISLKATSFPILHLQNGLTIIVDITNNLPKNIESLIEACWTNYRVVHLMGKDDLRSALTKILNVCDYPKIYKKGEPLELRGDITLRVTGDWIL
ncbi:MAG: LysM peptidoglycan-binding domain-containing protein, partial [Deltaproteobacteria bacterium]